MHTELPEAGGDPATAHGNTGPEPDGRPTPTAASGTRTGRRTSFVTSLNAAFLVGWALALGVLAGIGTGYVVQAAREPEPPPPLTLPPVADAAAKPRPPVTAAEDRGVRTEGDLLRMLVSPPPGATDVERARWVSPGQYATAFARPGGLAHTELPASGVRRIATTSWTEETGGGRLDVRAFVLQFDTRSSAAAQDYLLSVETAAGPEMFARGRITGSADGFVRIGDRPVTADGGTSLHAGLATAWSGDLAIVITLRGTEPVSTERAHEVAEAQWRRL